MIEKIRRMSTSIPKSTKSTAFHLSTPIIDFKDLDPLKTVIKVIVKTGKATSNALSIVI